MIQYDWCPYMKRKLGRRHLQRKDNGKTVEENCHIQDRDSSEEAHPGNNTLISDV